MSALIEPPFDEFAWAVGIIEGEGYIGLVRASRHVGTNNYVRISVQMTDEDVVRRLREALGQGRVRGPRFHPGTNRQPTWLWDIAGSAAYHLLYRLLPHLGNRRRVRALECLAELGAIDESQLEIEEVA